MAAPDFSIGGRRWPGISKLIEECGEVQQVCGKLLATGGDPAHWEGTDLRVRLAEEIADLMAAIMFVVGANQLPDPSERAERKRELFWKWHREQLADKVGA
jgi:NTP pyrophosphatase (non-canonical NTP hydrolase)